MRPNPRSFSIPWITRKLWLPLRSKSHNRRCEIYWGSHAPIDPIHRLESMNWMNSDEHSDLYRITTNRPMHRMRPEPLSLCTDHHQLGTGLSLLDLLHLRAMRLYTDAKRTYIVKSKTIESGGVHDRRRSNPAVVRSSLTFRPCSNILKNDLGWSIG